MRKLSWVIAGVLYASMPAVGQSAELGVATVNSNLTEPLSVRIPLNVSAQHPVDEVEVGLAPAEAFDDAGLGMEGIIGNIRFNVVEDGAQAYVDVTSRRPITEPILTLLLQARSGQGSMIRRYTLLLDPPVETRTPPAPSPTPDTATEPEPPAAAPAPVSTWQRVADVPDLEMTGSYHVESGDTLYAIARQYAEHEREVRPLMQAIIDANPQAFVNGDGNSLFADVTLDVPEAVTAPEQTADSVEEQPPAEDDAEAEVVAGAADEAAEEAEASEALEVAAESDPMLSLLDVEEAQAGEAEVDPIREEELLALQSQNENLQSQLAEVGDEINAMQEALQLRDEQLAELQDQVDASQERAAQAQAEALALEDELRAQQNNFFITWGPYLTGALGLIIIALALALFMRRDARAKEAASTRELAQISEQTDNQSTAGIAAAGAAAGIAASQVADANQSDTDQDAEHRDAVDDDPFADAPIVDDEGDAFADQGNDHAASSLTPEAAAEEARVLASFNLNSQAEEMLQETLQSHPDHPVLIAALNEIRNEDSASDSDEQWTTDAADSDVADLSDDKDSVEADAEAQAFDEDTQDDDLVFEPSGSTESAHKADDDPLDLPDYDEPTEPETAIKQDQAKQTSDDPEDELEFDLSDYEPAGSAEPEAPDQFADAGMDLELPEADDTLASKPADESPESKLDDADALDLPTLDDEPTADETGVLDQADHTDAGLDDSESAFDLPTEDSDSGLDEGSADDQVDTRVGLAEAFLEMGDQDGFEMIEAELRDENDTAALAKLDEIKQRYQ